MRPSFETQDRLAIGFLLFPQMDQMDFTGPFEIFCRLPDATLHLLGRTAEPIVDDHGLVLTPGAELSASPPLDLLVLPGGGGVNRLLEDEIVLEFVRRQAATARVVLSVCTGALLAGAAGLLRGRRATTHWAAHSLLPLFGAIPVDRRVVIDGKFVSTAGVTAGFDGSLRVAALLRGEAVAQTIQLEIEYQPEPPFPSGSPETAPAEVLEAMQAHYRPLIEKRKIILEKVARRLKAADAEP